MAETSGKTNAQVLRLLLLAKRESDRRNWDGKYDNLRKAIGIDRRNFYVDQPAGRHWGVTHSPTGFRIHAPARIVKDLSRRAPDADAGDPGQFEVDPLDMPALSKISSLSPAALLAALIRELGS